MRKVHIESYQSIKLVIFDCDGVLLDSEKIANEVEIEALKTLNIDIDSEQYQKRFAGVTTKNVFAILAKEYNKSISPQFLKKVENKVVDVLEKEVRIIPNIKKALQEIKIPKVVASNSHFSRLSKLLTIKKLTQFFDGYIFSADMVKNPKPAPDIYKYIAKKMQVSPDKCLVIEDSETGVQAARQAGMNVLGFIKSRHFCAENEEKLLKAGASQVFCEMKDLPDIIHHLSNIDNKNLG